VGDLQCAVRVMLVSPGETEHGSDVTTGSGGTLTPRGREQARAAGDALRSERVAHVYCSMLARAVQTAELVADRLGVEVTAREGLQEVAPDVPVRTVAGRVRAVLDEIADLHRGETVVVVTHGGAILATLAGLAWQAGREDDVPPCSTWVLERDADGWVAR